MLTSSKRLIRLTSLTIAASVCLSGALVQAVPLVWGNNSGNLTWDTTSANWGDGVTVYNNATPDAVVFERPGGLNNFQSINVAAGLTPASVTFSTNGENSMNGNGWGGSGSLIKNGPGQLNLFKQSSYTGGTFINAGRLSVRAFNDGFGGLVGAPGFQNVTVASGATLMGHRANFSGTLTLNGGTYSEDNGFGGSWTGSVILNTNSIINNPHTITINGVVSGSGGMTKSSGGLLKLNGVNTYTGNTFINGGGTITLSDNAGLQFDIGAAGVNNRLYGNGSGIFNLNGDFTFDLTGASRGEGDTWNIVDIASLNATFGSTFTVNGFADIGNNQWQTLFGGTTFIFSEATGLLVAVPEPSSFALLGLASVGLVGLGFYRRRRSC